MPGDLPEPMYVVAVSNYVYVGDRHNNWVVVFTSKYDLVKLMPAGNGVFHMWADAAGKQLWLNNDIDKTISVFDLQNLVPIKTINIPSDIAAADGKPHDIVLSPDGKHAFVTITGLNSGTLLKYNTMNYSLEQRRDDLAGDPHVGLTHKNNKLYVPQQNGDIVTILNQDDILEDAIAEIAIPGAHGIGTSPFSSAMYVANIEGDGVYAIDLLNNMQMASATDSPSAPHNIAASSDKIFITHSGQSSNKVSVFEASANAPIPVFKEHIEVGFNPFGIAYVEPRGCVPSTLL